MSDNLNDKIATWVTTAGLDDPELQAAALRVLRQCGAEDLAEMLGLVEA